MTTSGSGGSKSPSHRRRHFRRRSTASEQGLKELGDQLEGSSAPGGAGSRSSRTSDTGPVANESGLTALGEQIRQADTRSNRRAARRGGHRHRLRNGIVISLAVLLVLVGAGAGYTYYLTHDLTRIKVNGLSSAFSAGQEVGSENILMVGSTSRCALKVQNLAYGLCSEGVNGVNSDVVMILHVDAATHHLALLSIPRDLFIPNARSTGANKVDAGLFEGISQLVAAIEEDFGIPIQHAVSLNFDQFANIVDALGGINMSFPESVFDAESGLNVQAATCVHLNGTQALEVVRARHLQYDAPGTTSTYAEAWPQENLSDLARIRRDHEFLRVLASAVAKRGLDDPLTDIDLINSVKADLTFDQSWSVNDMADLVIAFHAVDINSVPQLTLPVAVVTDPDGSGGGLMYEGGNYGDVEFPSQGEDQSVIDQVLGIGSSTDSMTGNPLPAPAAVKVSVMNGSGAYNQASDTASALSALGFDTVGVGDLTPTGDVAETVVYYGSKSAATEAAAERVARSMTGSVIMAYDPGQVADGAQVTVVTGTQFAVNPPATPVPTPSVGGSTTTTAPTTTTTTASSSAAVAPPSPASTGLQPWDPRACPAGATPTAPVANPTY